MWEKAFDVQHGMTSRQNEENGFGNHEKVSGTAAGGRNAGRGCITC